MNECKEIGRLFDKDQIIETILRFSYSMDLQNWNMLRDCLCEEVEIDYRDFRGEPAKIISADDFVSLRIKGLENLKTQHTTTNHSVNFHKDNSAICTSDFIIYRKGLNQNGEEDFLNSRGIYIHELKHKNKQWLIKKITQKVFQIDGNREIHGAFREEK